MNSSIVGALWLKNVFRCVTIEYQMINLVQMGAYSPLMTHPASFLLQNNSQLHLASCSNQFKFAHKWFPCMVRRKNVKGNMTIRRL